MKTRLPVVVALATCISAVGVHAQDQRPPQPSPAIPGGGFNEPNRPPRPGEPGRPPGPPDAGRPPQPPLADRPPVPREHDQSDDGPRKRLRIMHDEGAPGMGMMMPPVPKGPRPFIGVVTDSLPPELGAQLGLPEGFGLLVRDVLPDSPAATAGIQKYDVLKLMNDQQLVDPGQFATLVRAAGKDTEVSITLVRKGQEQKVNLKVGERILPQRKPLDGFGDMMPKMDNLRRSIDEKMKRLPEQLKPMEENVRRMKERAKEYQDRVMKWQDHVRDSIQRGGGAVEAAPTFEPVPGGDILKEAKPDGGGKIKVFTESSTTTVDGQKARLFLKDKDGEVEVSVENGKRTLTAKDPSGNVVFTGPVNTDDERKAVPEAFRDKLEKIQIRQSADGNTAALSVETNSGAGDEFDEDEVQ